MKAEEARAIVKRCQEEEKERMGARQRGLAHTLINQCLDAVKEEAIQGNSVCNLHLGAPATVANTPETVSMARKHLESLGYSVTIGRLAADSKADTITISW